LASTAGEYHQVLLISRSTKWYFLISFTPKPQSSAMANQQLSRTSPTEGFSVARKAMDDAIAFFIPIGGPALARQHVELLANSMNYYPDITEAYRDAMTKISEIEKAEQQRQEERQQQLIIQLISTAKPHKGSDPLCEFGVLPARLSTDKAMQMWKCLQRAGFVDEHYQPVGLSRTLSAVLADEMLLQLSNENERLLGIDDKWRPFEILWCRKNMKADHYRSLNQHKASTFRTKVRKLLTAIS
jgi:hypothetical protein